MRVLRSPDVLWRTAGGYLVVCAPSGACVEIGGSAASVWAALPVAPDGAVPVDALVQQLADESATAPSEVEPVVRAVLDVLQRHGCIARAA
ncbi:MAG TPA: hypothetical protein DCR14_15770 [Acidimicrobiaceae bacterium]|nr:hypothetical protein [Acidimicrobiaceae bacterium]